MKSKSHIFKEKDLSGENLVDYLRSAISDGTAGLTDVPMLIRQIIENDSWRERFVSQTKDIVVFNSFTEFVHTAPPEGLGTTLKVLIKMCSDFPDIMDLIDVTDRSTSSIPPKKHGGDRRSVNFKSDNLKLEKLSTTHNKVKNLPDVRGNSSVYALRRLREKRPDLHCKVLEKKLSINKAMIEAGWRKSSPRIITEKVEVAAELLKKAYSRKQIKRLIELLSEKV